MIKLYTSLVHAKLTLNGGELRAMTPLPERYHDIIDPAFTIGLGALREVEGKGLQCPVRGCGVWRHRLDSHMKLHRDIGGSARIKEILSIPEQAGLVSCEFSEKASATTKATIANDTNGLIAPSGRQRPGARGRFTDRRKSGRTHTRRAKTTGSRNLRNSCEAQIAHRLLDIANKVGRSPSKAEADHYDPGLSKACERVYGSWNAAKIVVGLEVIKTGPLNRFDREAVLDLLSAYYDKTGTLPSYRQCRRRDTHPLLPSVDTITRHLSDNRSWKAAMDLAAWKLHITDGRYGKPEYAVRMIADG